MIEREGLSLTFLAAGKCRQKARLAGRLESGWIDFHAVFVHLVHPTKGSFLIDTGYGPAYLEAVRHFPERILNWLLPVSYSQSDSPREQVRRAGFDPDALAGVFVSHFHADHIGGLKEFAGVPMWTRRSAYETASRGGRISRLRRGFVQQLMPNDFSERVTYLEEADARSDDPELPGFRVWDLFGDGLVKWVDLPGHAAGHVGYLLRSNEGPLFYIVDACWDVESMLAGRRLPWLGRNVQSDWSSYQSTQQKLTSWHRETGIPVVACHCQRTLERVANRSN